MNVGARFRILRSEAEIETVRKDWERWQQHPHSDLDFFLMIVKTRPEVISPYVLALYRDDVLHTLLVGRLERAQYQLSVGYWRILGFPVRTLSFVYGGLLGDTSGENCATLLRGLAGCLKRERAHLATLHFVKVGSPMHRAACRMPRLLCHDYFDETQPHWVMKLPGDSEEIYKKMSPKARQNRRYEMKRLFKTFPTARVECFTEEADLDLVMEDAECIARRTYQRGLGVGFFPDHGTRERLALEAARGRFRAYLLYLGDRPVAFFIGTLSRGVLYDNFTAYDPEYGNYSPGTVLFLQIFERLCREGVEAVDFGFGGASYKAQFGNDRSDETTVSVFAPTFIGVGLNLLRVPTAIVHRLGKAAVRNLTMFRSVKRQWRGRAQKRASARSNHALPPR